MRQIDFVGAVERICRKDPRYDSAAYFFLREALDFTVKMLDRPRRGPGRHVTGQELLEGVRRYALQEFGPMALTVLTTWGVKQTGDFGDMVFNLVETGVLGKTSEDKKEDFANGYSFDEAFAAPFKPKSAAARNKGKPTRKQSAEEPGKDT